MFWTVRADCSPSLPTSGPAIVARAKWMGSEPEMVLNKAALVSNNRLEGIQNHTAFTAGGRVTNNKHSVSHTYTEMTVDTHTVQPPPFPYKSGEQLGWTAARLEWSAVTGLAGIERERDDTPVYCRALSLLKYITHSKWSCWSPTAVDLITWRTLYGCSTF